MQSTFAKDGYKKDFSEKPKRFDADAILQAACAPAAAAAAAAAARKT